MPTVIRVRYEEIVHWFAAANASPHCNLTAEEQAAVDKIRPLLPPDPRATVQFEIVDEPQPEN